MSFTLGEEREREGGLMEASTLQITPADRMEIFLFYYSHT